MVVPGEFVRWLRPHSACQHHKWYHAAEECEDLPDGELFVQLKPRIGFLYRNKSCRTMLSRKKIMQATILPVLDNGDTLYSHASVPVLKPLGTNHNSFLCFVMWDGLQTHHCDLYRSVGWSSSGQRRRNTVFCLFTGKLSLYLTSLLSTNSSSHTTRSQDWVTLKTPRYRTECDSFAQGRRQQ